MKSQLPACKSIEVVAFRGDRSGALGTAVLKALDDEKKGRGVGPSLLECLLFAGHLGVSTNGSATVFAFNPDGGGIALWRLLEDLRNGAAFPGVVRDDTAVFVSARKRGHMLQSLEIVLPEPRFLDFERKLDGERRNSQYTYGFPDGDGDCNCITWLERMGLPLLTGRMAEFNSFPGIVAYPSRLFGACV
jgi:hypothetical protein